MTLDSVKSAVFHVLLETGVVVDWTGEDFDLREAIQSSIQFVSFIVNLEQALGIEIHDELLNLDQIASFNGFCNSIFQLVNE